jgi:hypothetical protein
MTTEAKWSVQGTLLQGCNCDYGCPCNFNARPTMGHCEGTWSGIIDQGSYGGVDLGGLNFTLICDWPAAIHEGNGECQILIDERATAEQRDGMLTIDQGEAGPPWSILKNTFSTYYEPQFVHYETKIDGANSSVRAGEFFHLEMESIKNPVTGAEAFPGIVLPQGLLYRESTRTSCKVYGASGKINYEYSGTDAAFSPFSWGSL